MLLNFTKDELEQLGAIHTATEIAQQPTVWKKVMELIRDQQNEIEEFLKFLNNNYSNVRVILTGAGTSAYIGETVLPYLKQNHQYNHFHYEAIPTTDLVSAPNYYFQKETPTLLVSFARSGNSPESLAASKLGEQIVSIFYQIIITCNEDGQLAIHTKNHNRSLLLLMPAETNDLGFAMTSSFTSMLLAASLIFQTNQLEPISHTLNSLTSEAHSFFCNYSETIDEMAKRNFDRIVYLGSAIFQGLAKESALKMLELTSGKTIAVYESPLGFRHGPKSFINDHTVIVFYLSNDPYTQKYELDMMKEIFQQSLNVTTIALIQQANDEIKYHCDYCIEFAGEKVHDMHLAFLYILFAQTLAFKKSIQLGIQPDHPSPKGIVHRVVQGVNIYPYPQ